MLELIDLGRKILKAEYRQAFPELENRLGECQREAREIGVPIIVVFEGWDAAGKGTVINRLTQSLDPRGFKVHPISAPNETEQYFPWMWRFRAALPADGHIAIFDRSWYGRVLTERVEGSASKRQWEQAYDDIQEFERQLADDGRVILKFWMHISKKEQKKRFKMLEKTPGVEWKVGKEEWKHHRKYDEWLEVVDKMIERTSTGYAPWTIIEATQERFARVKVFETVLDAIEGEIQRRKAMPKPKGKPMPEPVVSLTSERTILDQVDLTLSMERPEYEEQLDKLQKKIWQLEHELYIARRPAVIAFEGADAGGKGGAIRRLTRGLDPRGYEVVPFAAPTAEEKSHHYLWRFWKNVPKAGHIAIFDRTWYGRVLVERVEGFCNESEWKRAYREINEFERQLTDFGTVVVKFWLQIDREEQLARFKAREERPEKQWKITDEDWRNRDKWKQYNASVVEMLRRTSTTYAPWTILEANCKLHARIKALRTVADALENAL